MCEENCTIGALGTCPYTMKFSASTYQLKSQFQKLLSPLMLALVRLKVSANQLSLLSLGLCGVFAASLFLTKNEALIYFLPIVLFLKICINALDGMLARYTKSESMLGEVLNDVGDVLADLFLFLGCFVVWQENTLWLILSFLVLVVEYSGLLAHALRGKRALHGPFGKSDRALFLGAGALLVSLWPTHTSVLVSSLSVFGIGLAALTIFHRTRYILS